MAKPVSLPRKPSPDNRLSDPTAAGSSGEHEFYEALRAAALEAHEAVSVESASRARVPPRSGDTTLTLSPCCSPGT